MWFVKIFRCSICPWSWILAQKYIWCPVHKHLLKNVTKLTVPLQLETAGGDLTLDTIGDLLCGGIVTAVCSISAQPKVRKNDTFKVKLERSGGLDYLVGGEEQCLFSCFTPGSVDGSHCRIDNVDIEHLRGGHLEFDPEDGNIASRMKERRREQGEKFVRISPENCQVAYNGSEYLLVALRRETSFGFVKALANKRTETIERCDGRQTVVVTWCLAVPQ